MPINNLQHSQQQTLDNTVSKLPPLPSSFNPNLTFDSSQLKTDENLRNLYYEHIKGDYYNADLKKGEEEFKHRSKLDPSTALDCFLKLVEPGSKKECLENYLDMCKKLDLNASSSKGSIFYSGHEAKLQAWKYARNHDCKAIEQTPGGDLFETWDWFNKYAFKSAEVPDGDEPTWGTEKQNDAYLVWGALSQEYANRSKDNAHVFQQKTGKIWDNFEKPTLEKKGTNYHIHVIDPWIGPPNTPPEKSEFIAD